RAVCTRRSRRGQSTAPPAPQADRPVAPRGRAGVGSAPGASEPDPGRPARRRRRAGGRAGARRVRRPRAPSLELTSVDTRFSIRASTGMPKDVVVVAIDDKTFQDFVHYGDSHPGFKSQWPFPRCDMATALRHIAAGRPRVIAVDIQFTEPTTRVCDNALI